MKFKVDGRFIGHEYPPLIIAEIGINHGGSLERAFDLVDLAKYCGCECVKTQYHIPDEEMINDGSELWKTINNCALIGEEEMYLREYIKKKGMLYLSTPFSFAAVDRLEKLGVDWYKIGSGECNNNVFVEYVASKGKPVILSTGMSRESEIDDAVDILMRAGVPHVLLYCVSLYPPSYDEINLNKIGNMARRYPESCIGLSDHTKTIWTSIAAMALGACVIEKHFTDNSLKNFPDHDVSICPNDMLALIDSSIAVYNAMRDRNINAVYDLQFASSVVAKRNILPGDEITLENCTTKRPGTGNIPAKEFRSVLGKKAVSEIMKNEQVRWDQVG